MKSFKEIYGDYATTGFIERIRDIAREAKGLAIMSRHYECNKDLHSDMCTASVEAVDYWNELEDKAEEWLRGTTCKHTFESASGYCLVCDREYGHTGDCSASLLGSRAHFPREYDSEEAMWWDAEYTDTEKAILKARADEED